MKRENSAEKEWLRRMKEATPGAETTKKKTDEETTDPVAAAPAEEGPVAKKRNGNGFGDVAGMEELKQKVYEGFINVLNNRECAKAYGITPPSMLFYGPAGCGKTYFAEKIAEEVGINFMKVVPDDIACQYIHGTQEKIAEVFRKAERKAPTLLFFDEFDAMVPRRTNSDAHHQNGEINEFLCMLNNAAEKNIFVLAATNHPEFIDKAVLRTGRIDELIYIDMPDDKARESLFRLRLSKLPAADDIDYARLASLTKGYNCSDISYIIKLASRKMFNESIREKDKPYKAITQSLLEETIGKKAPSVSAKDLREYERMRREFSPEDKEANARPEVGFY